MKKIDETVARIQNHFGVKTRKEMMEKWGIPYSTYKTWAHRDSLPRQRLVELAEREGLNLEWLTNGTGNKYKVSPLPEPKFLTKEISEEINAYVAEAMPNYGTDKRTVKLCKLFDALDEDVKDEVLEKIMPYLKTKL